MPDDKYDIIIIGGGPAGLTAAIYTLRKELKTLIVSQDLGGQVAITNEVENYPGFDLISGPELITKFRQQVEKFSSSQSGEAGGKIILDQVVKIEPHESHYKVKANNQEFESLAVILAFGLTPRDLGGVPGEDKFKGRGISFCATCDAPLYKGKTVAIVGGGNSALEAVEELTKIAKKVYLIHRKDTFRGDQILIDRLPSYKNLEQLLNSDIVEFIGEQKLEKIIVKNSAGKKEVEVDGVFLEIGHITKTDWLKDFVDLNKQGEIIIDDKCLTSRPGIFAAGDVTTLAYKQIIIAAGEGAKAALSAYNYISKKTGVTAPPDWGKFRG